MNITRKKTKKLGTAAAGLLILAIPGGFTPALASPLAAMLSAPLAATPTVPQGFKIEVYASGLTTPRELTFAPNGDLYVAELNAGDIKVLPDRNHDGKPDSVTTFASGLTRVNNVAFYSGAAYAGVPTGVYKLVDTGGNNTADQRTQIVSSLPGNGRHTTRTVHFGPDNKLYVNVGSYNDDGVEPSASRATIYQFNADGSGGRIYSSGLRNTVDFGWDAGTGAMWGVDNEVDDLGANLPPDELNQLVDGGNYGYPYCYGNKIQNPNTPGGDCSRTIGPAATFPPHAAPLGMAFYTGSSFPQSYRGGVFATLHSANYPANRALDFVPFVNGKPSGAPQVFSSNGATWVGVAVDPYDGSLFATQDSSGVIYRISYAGAAQSTTQSTSQPQATPTVAPAPTAVAGHPAPQPATPLSGSFQCFSQTNKCLRGAFLDYWNKNGGTQQLGLPVTNELTEKLSDGKTYTVQYTERARLEYHPENKPPYDVLLGRLGADLVASRTGEALFKPVPNLGNANVLYFPETQHTLSPDLRSYWESHGGIPVFGFPLSQGFQEKSPTDGKTYEVQYFERNRLEYHPENAGTQYEVELGLLGVQTYAAQYGANP